MKLSSVAIAVLLFASSVVSAAEFKTESIATYRAVYEQGVEIYKTGKLPGFNAFADMIASGWVVAHKQAALECSKDVVAKPECVWELPYANDWLGCMFFQFDNAEIFEQVHFETFKDEPFLNGWISKHKDELPAPFLDTMSNLTEIANKCETIIRQQPPVGAIDV